MILFRGIPVDIPEILSTCDGLYFPFIRRDFLVYQQMEMMMASVITTMTQTEPAITPVLDDVNCSPLRSNMMPQN
jgi:hypothetical protein